MRGGEEKLLSKRGRALKRRQTRRVSRAVEGLVEKVREACGYPGLGFVRDRCGLRERR